MTMKSNSMLVILHYTDSTTFLVCSGTLYKEKSSI